MITTLEPTVKTLPVIDNLCEHIAPLPTGKAAVLQDKFYELLQEGTKLYKRQGKLGDKSRYITLEAYYGDNMPGEITGEIWTKASEYIRLNTVVTCKIERPFCIAVDLEVLKLTVASADKGQRLDLTVDTIQNVLTLNGGSWRSNFKGLPAVEMCEPVDSKPAPVYTKEQQREFKWLGKAAAKQDNRPVLRFAHAEKRSEQTFVATADGYRAHYTTSEYVQGLDGFIDVNKVGYLPDHRFPDVGYIASHITGQKVNVYIDDLLKAVKSVMKMKPDADELTFTFHSHVLTITGHNVEKGKAESHMLCSTVKDGFFKVNGKFILDALAGCDGIPNRRDPNKKHTVMFQFEDNKKPIRIVPHVGRMVVVMPMQEKR